MSQSTTTTTATKEVITTVTKVLPTTSLSVSVGKLREVMKFSKVLKDMFESRPSADEKETLPSADDETEITIPKMNEELFEKVREYCILHKDDEPKPESVKKSYRPIISAVDEEFMKGTSADFDMVLAQVADFLDIQPLLSLCCKKTALRIKGKSKNEIMAMYGRTTPFTAKEDELFLEKFPFIKESRMNTQSKTTTITTTTTTTMNVE